MTTPLEMRGCKIKEQNNRFFLMDSDDRGCNEIICNVIQIFKKTRRKIVSEQKQTLQITEETSMMYFIYEVLETNV